MRKGISPIVSVVLLIAIAVIAAVGLYFWVGGLATKQPASEKPKTITVICTPDSNSSLNGTLLVTNNSPAGSGNVIGPLSSNVGGTCTISTIAPGQSAPCTAQTFSTLPGTSGALYSTTQSVSQAAYSC